MNIFKHLSYSAQRETEFYPLLCVSKRFHTLKKEEILEEFVQGGSQWKVNGEKINWFLTSRNGKDM